MIDNTLIQVITKNNPNKVNKILESIKSNTTLNTKEILLIDDSSDDSFVVQNTQVIDNSGLSVNHITSKIWNIYKQQLLSSMDSNLIDKSVLGVSEWNTPNVRNIGLVLTAGLYSQLGNVVYFDDDIDVSKLNFSSEKILSSIEGIHIGGCPDLSRVEWIQLYIRLLGKIITNTEYADNLFKKYSVLEIMGIISKYTDLSIDSTNEDGIINGNIPSREEFSGGAYVNSIENIGIGVFPSIYNEDWCYASMMKSTNRLYNSFYSGGSVVHDSSKKNILNKEELLKEEFGEFFQLYFRLKDKSKYRLIIENKISLITQEIKLCSKLVGISSSNEINFMYELLGLLLDFYIGLKIDISKIIDVYNENLEDNKDWRDIYKHLPRILSIEKK